MRITLLLTLALFSAARAASPLDDYPPLMDALVAGDYDRAHALCDSLTARHGDHPAALLARVCVLGTYHVDFIGAPMDDAAFSALVTAAVDNAAALPGATPQERAEREFLRGGALFARAIVAAADGKFLPAFSYVMDAREAFDAAIEQQPDFYDAYVGRGAFRYAMALYLSDFNFMGILVSEETARADLLRAADSSRFSRAPAAIALAWLAMNGDDFTMADSLCAAGLQRYPGARSFLWPQFFSAMKQQRWAAAESGGLQLLEQYRQLPADNGYEVTGLYRHLMNFADAQGRTDDAREYARLGLAASRSDDVERRRKQILNELRQRLDP